jgi:hypothetical protein
MKKFMIGATMVMLAIVAQAQASADLITKFFSKYQNDESFTQVTISSKMFNLFTNMEVDKPEDQEVLNAISKLKGLRVLAKEDARNARELYKEALSLVPVKEFEELMSVRDKDKDMKFYIKETSPGKISELVMIAGGVDNFMVLSLFGEIDLKQVSKIGSKMDIDGLDQLKNMDKKNTPKDGNSKDNKKNEEK